MKKKPSTPLPPDHGARCAKFRQSLFNQGISMSDWARQQGINYNFVKDALRGKLKGQYGKSHAVYVAMGLKDGVQS